MRLIDRYILRRTAVLTIPTLAVISGVVVTTQLLLNVEMVTRSASAAFAFLKIGAFLTPSVTLMVLPFAVLLGSIRTLSAMNGDNELAVLEAAGRSPLATTRPILLFALCASAFTFLTTHIVEPASTRAMQNIYTAATADLVRLAMRNGAFTPLGRDIFVQIGEEMPNGEMADVVFVDSSDPEAQVIYFAKRGNLIVHEGTTLLALSDGEVHRRNKVDGNLSIISFISSATELSGGDSTAMVQGPQSIATAEIVDRISTGTASSDEVRELHRRMSEWMYPLLLAAIAVVVCGSAGSGRQSRAFAISIGVGAALALRAAGFVAVSNAGVSHSAAIAAYALPATALAALLAMILTGTFVRMPGSVETVLARLAAWLSGSNRRKARATGGAAR